MKIIKIYEIHHFGLPCYYTVLTIKHRMDQLQCQYADLLVTMMLRGPRPVGGLFYIS